MSSSSKGNGRKVYKIASLPADGIGPEVISAGIQVLEKVAATVGTFDFHFDHIEWGSDYYKKYGYYIPEGGLESLKQYNAILFGSVGAPGKSVDPIMTISPSDALDYYIPVLYSHFQTNASYAQTCPTTSRSGACASLSASRFNNTPTCAPPKFYAAFPRP